MSEVSIVIPAYNAEKYISEAINSVLNQTYKDFEIIVIDDGSADNTAKVVKEYITKFPNKIKYFYQENKGPAAARNRGIKEAKGEYIAFLDADDIWLKEKLEEQIEYFGKYPNSSLIYSRCKRIDKSNNELPRVYKEARIGEDSFINLWWDNFIPTSTTIVKKVCFDNLGLFDESRACHSAEDLDMWLRIAKEYKIGYVDKLLVKYRVTTDGFSRSNINRAYRASKLLIERFSNEVRKRRRRNTNKFINNRFHKLYYEWGVSQFYVSNFKDAHKRFSTAIKYNPQNFSGYLYYLLTLLNRNSIESLRKLRCNLIFRENKKVRLQRGTYNV